MRRLLIANRGEIAVRIARSARILGIETVAIVSEADRDSFSARIADQSVVIGPAAAKDSYLNPDAVLAAARETGADAIHPGYGFLSENAAFARAVIAAGLIWVGPDPDTIELMGDKSNAIRAAKDAGVPVLPGTGGPLSSEDDVVAIAREIGYPLLVKASAGGGGRGIRHIASEDELISTIELASSEAASVFGDPSVYLERFVSQARHVEVQLLADGENCIHLGDRDCSLQRRSQKVVEEAPAPEIPDHVRERMRAASVRLALASGYRGAGTVEFLYDAAREEAAFIEMNTRLQVEHTITEEITGIDLVREQLRIADGEALGMTQDDVRFDGHAIECRINAENPSQNFFPSPGRIAVLEWPDGIRVDSGFEAGDVVVPFYDSMIAKVIVHAPTRIEAIERMRAALTATRIEGIETTIPLHLRLLEEPDFLATAHHTKTIETGKILEGL
ncbi:acetyl-CoA carboxylase biotin carboxylase subunit [Microbacterium sp. MYb72]|uniref:acetyl-CoA carboxylase biotin carboxylase subunit n=1 Tax=Microbacterium sp. MYb72 TaxID=1848693 RepID=UPI000CFC2433|nr:acetyl-CoA carboxylase biotin carboxylase subunit [Microbacterium sp. MYb72]PRB04744.1 acetyl-CoA carboxylase biotin carboxylase subunit [Microbacterium sp. MYb72]